MLKSVWSFIPFDIEDKTVLDRIGEMRRALIDGLLMLDLFD
ncbi:MAG: hypothetical protein QXN87_04160 [Candidatus Bathyarchaeia archaeon]